jgi:hypothetical protein
VVEAVQAVVRGAGIEAAWPDWKCTDSTTTWSCWVVTAKILGYVRVEYGRASYDETAEREQKLTPSSQSAWLRPLTDVIQLRWGAVQASPAQRDTYHLSEPMTVTFSNGETTIPERDFSVEERPTADRIMTAVRKGLGF